MAQGIVDGGLYELPMEIKRIEYVLNVENLSNNYLWHLLLGHLNNKAVKDLVNNGRIKSD